MGVQMKKLLLIQYFFAPLMRDWRGLTLVKLLPEFGWQPIVISAAESVSYGKDYSLLKEVPREVEVHRVGHREPSKLWQYAKSRLKINYDFPDYYKSWYTPALREARRILQRAKVDLLFSASPCYTAAFVAMKLKKEFNIPWVAELQDPWSGNDYGNRHYDATLIRPLRKLQKLRIRRGEREILEVADKVNVISWHHKQQLCELHGFGEEKIEVVTDGYNESDFTELKPHPLYPDKLTIVFFGGIYLGQQELALRFFEVVNEVDRDAEVVLMGGVAEMEGVNTDNLTRIRFLTRKERLLNFASGGDFFLLIALPSAKWHILGKIWDYLRLGKPILALVPEDGDAAKIVREAKAGSVLSYEPEKMKEQLKVIFDEWRKGKFKDFHPDWEYISQFERRNLIKKLAQVFDEVSSK
jgi:glycosyltransferase involved in cell wall biosynthesis